MSASYLCISQSVGSSQVQLFTSSGDTAFLGSIVNTISDCTTGFVVEIATTSQPTLQDIFAIPLEADLQNMWMAGFGTPIICYLTAWSINVLIDMFNTRNY
jgi:hypothetical protein